MFKEACFIILAGLFSSACYAVEYVKPVLEPGEVVVKTERFLLQKKLKTLNGYRLSQINFVFYSEYKIENGYWMLSYACDLTAEGIRRADCGFYVNVTNAKEPEFSFQKIGV